MEKTLTIAVPTFNRSRHLQRLLDALAAVDPTVLARVEIIVSDNHSTDDTPAIVAAARRKLRDLRVMRNPENIGADANLAKCFAAATGRHVWLIGDDDMPKTGVVAAVVELIEKQDPDIVYAPSEWFDEVVDAGQGSRFDPARVVTLDRLNFVRYVNIWMTFISCMIVKRVACAAGPDTGDLHGTCLPQLAWVVPAIRSGTRFAVFGDQAVLATGGNTGGYAVLEVFGSTFPKLMAEQFGDGSPEYRSIVGRTVSGYLPNLVWTVRQGTVGRFDRQIPWDLMRKQLGGFPAFWAWIVPAGRAPRPIALLALAASRLSARLQQAWERKLRYRL